MKRASIPLLLLLLGGCETMGLSSSRPVADLHERYIRSYAKLDPNWATSAGIHDYDDRLTRYDDASYAARRDLTLQTLETLRAVDVASLSENERLDYRLFLAQLTVEEYEYSRRDDRTVLPDLPLGSISAVHELLIKDFAPREKRVADALSRLRQIREVCADARTILGRPPRLWTEMALEDLEGAFAFLDEIPILLGDAPEAKEVLAGVREVLHDYRRFLRDELLPRSDGSFAAGREAYEFRLKNGLLLPYTADELARIGEREFEATVTMLEATAKSIDSAKTWSAILEEMNEDHPTAENLMRVYREETEKARRFMIEKEIVTLPDEQLRIVETPPFQRSTTPFAAYNSPAPMDESRLGHFYVTPDPEAHVSADIPGTVWHEAYPGHHLQFVYAKDSPSLVRRLNSSPLLVEGWGFYCEELAAETGYYHDPKERLMQLYWRLIRAARIILDVALHTGRLNYEEAVEFLMTRVGMLRKQAEGSVNGYTKEPTYYSCYMLGMLEIKRIREKLRVKMGDRFRLRDFHDQLLKYGNVSPALLEAEFDRGTP